MNKIKDNIKQKRIDKGMTQEELAKAVYSTKSTISKWENGSITPGIDMLKIIAKALDTKFYELIGEQTPIKSRIMDIIAKVFFYLLAWIHIDVVVTGELALFGFVAILIGATAGAGGWIAYIVFYSLTSWGTGSILITIGFLAAGPFIFAILSFAGYGLLNISRCTGNFSLRWFWKSNKKIPEVKKFEIKMWMIILLIASFVVGSIFLIIGGTLYPEQININFS